MVADTPCWISDQTGAAMLDLSRSSWWRRVHDGTLPKGTKIGGATRWRLDEVVTAIERATEAHSAKPATRKGGAG